jgi:succinate dehydrogenase/fumarate reductase flavoprotein subunit
VDDAISEQQLEDLTNERNVYKAALMMALKALDRDDSRGKTHNRMEARIERAQIIMREALR